MSLGRIRMKEQFIRGDYTMKEQLYRYFEGVLSDSEKDALFRQLHSDDALMDAFVELQRLWAISGMTTHAADDTWTESKYQKILQRIRKRRKRFLYISWMKYAAVAVLFFSLCLIWMHISSKEQKEDFIHIESPKGQRTYLVLPDSTEVWLNSRSRLKISNRFNEKDRSVMLDGEGLFHVHKDENNPFTVRTKQYDVVVTGTKFNVFAYSLSPIFETDLIEGSVSIYNPDNQQDMLHLRPNEKGYSEAGVLQRTVSSFAESESFKNGLYAFEDRSLAYLAQRLELWYDVKICITNPNISEYSFSGKFRQTDEMNKIFDAIKETGKFDYTILNEEKIEIY